MNNNIKHLYTIAQKEERLIIGLMSGTSLDGLDIALCKFKGAGTDTTVEVIKFETIPYSIDFKTEIRTVFSKRQVDLKKLCLLNEWIGIEHGKLINDCLKTWRIENASIDLIASHGQTIYHAPKKLHQLDKFGNGTLQIGDGDHLAVTTGIITLSDFRQKHIAVGGEGAPLAIYGDYLLFNHPTENRVLLNIGGIANCTYLPAGNDNINRIISTDTGTGNTLMDAYIQKHFHPKQYDDRAFIAKSGTINGCLLAQLKAHEFFSQPFPKSTGPELFNLEYVEDAMRNASISSISHNDILATLNKFTADTIAEAIQKIINLKEKTVIYSSGGGIHNPLLMEHLQLLLPQIEFRNCIELGIHPDAKEAVLFAVLANESLCGNKTEGSNSSNNMPQVSMGKISFPS